MSDTRWVPVSATLPRHGDGEDRVAIHELPDGLVIAVADGAGGMAGGARAADRLVALLGESLRSAEARPFDPFFWRDFLQRADDSIAHDPAAGETTAVVVALSSGGIAGASAGDSEAWVVSEGAVDDLTVDQQKRRLGSGQAVVVPFLRPSLAGTLLVGSDGLFHVIAPDVITRLVQSAGTGALAALTSALRLPSGDLHDDTAIVLVGRASVDPAV